MYYEIIKFFGIDYIFLLGLSCLGIYLSIINYKKDKFRFIKYLPAILFIIAIILIFLPLRLWKIQMMLNDYRNRNLEVLELKADKKTEYQLPNKCYKLSKNGESIVLNNGNDVVIGYWIFKSAISGLSLIVYSPSGEQQINKKFDVLNAKKIAKNWYYVDIRGNAYYS